MVNLKRIMFLGLGLLLGSNLKAQTTVNFTHDSTMVDAMVADGTDASTNFGAGNQMKTFHETTASGDQVFRTFMHYDLSAIPAEAMITSASLKLNAQSVDNTEDHPIYIERVDNETWTESAITWSNQPDVITVDRLSFTHAQTSSTGLQEFDVTEHVQAMVSFPDRNKGWCIRLQDEATTGNYGIVYHSSEAGNVSKRPVLTIEYIMPLEMATSVTHCTPGNNDGALTIDLTGGSTYGIGNMFFYKTNRDLSHRGKATFSNYKVTGNLSYNAATGVVTAENLEPGIYVFRILDATYYGSSDLRFAFYKHILVGREGEVTSGILIPNYQYQENVTIEYDKPANPSPLDRANTNYHTGSSLIPLRVSDSPNNYEKASLIKYEIDFDDQLEFSKAELQINAWSSFFRHNNSSNAVKYSRLTSDWEETQVTWNTRPSVDPTDYVIIPTTTTIGYDPVRKYDTINFKPMVDYWTEHPEENYGFEIALETYGAIQGAQRDYRSAANNLNYVCFEFSVKEPVTTAFNDNENRGTLTVNAPSGDLPYTYLINTQPLGTLADVWADISSFTSRDSVLFFQGDTSTTEYTFTDLPPGKYYTAVYDNNGTKIMEASQVVNAEISVYNDTDLDFSSAHVAKKSAAASGDGKGRLYGELLADEAWGGVKFVPEVLGSFYLGFNKTGDALPTNETDLEFGMKVNTAGAYLVISNNVVLATGGSLTTDQEVSILREHDEYLILIDGVEVYRGSVSNLDGEDATFDLVLEGATAEIRMEHYWGNFKHPNVGFNITYPECGASKGAITVNAGEGVTITSCIVENNDDEGTDPLGGCAIDGSSCVFADVPIGTYTVTIGYDVTLGYTIGSYSIQKQVAVGYVVEWEEMVNNYVSPLNTIQKGPGPVIPIDPGTANSTNMTVDDYPGWVHFETDVSSYLLGSLNAERLMLRNLEGDIIYQVGTSLLSGTSVAFVYGDAVMLGSSLLAGPNGVWRIEYDGDDYELFKNNFNLSSVTANSAAAPPIYEIGIVQEGTAKYIRTIASFCNNYPVADQYIEPKREVEGGYYQIPKDDQLRFEFNEEYTIAGDLNYEIRDFAGIPYADALAALPEIYGDNRFVLDVSSLADGYYVMEIINDKGENWFLRFKK